MAFVKLKIYKLGQEHAWVNNKNKHTKMIITWFKSTIFYFSEFSPTVAVATEVIHINDKFK